MNTAPDLVVRNIARHHASNDAPRIAFQELAPASRTQAPAPLFLLGPANPALHQELFHQTQISEVGCYAIEDATLAPAGIAIKDNTAFTSPAFTHTPTLAAPIAARLFAARDTLPPHQVRGPLAVIYGPGHDTYGHWLVDFLPRLWVLAQTGHDILTMRYAVPPELNAMAINLLASVGIRPSQLVPYRYWREVLRTDLLLLPTGLRTDNRLSPLFAQATQFWTTRLARQPRPDQTPAKLFLSRSRIAPGQPGQRTLLNRSTIETIAARRNYAIIHPETLPIPQQITLFAGARIIAGEYGSALHGSVYAPPNTVTIGLRGTARHPSFVQSAIAGALNQHAGYVLGHTHGEIEQRFSIQPEDFERALDIAELQAGSASF